MDKFKYLVVMISTDGGMGEEGSHRVLEGGKVWGTMGELWKESRVCREVKRNYVKGL